MTLLTKFSMKNIAAVFILILLLTGGGIYASSSLKVESMPDISFPVVMVSTQYAAPPKDVLDNVTKPIEKAVANLEGLKNLTSSSMDNFSSIVIELEQGRNTDDAKKDVESLIANVKLPQGSEKPKVMTYGFASQPVYYMSVSGVNGMNQSELDRIYRDVIEPGFNSIKGIDHIDSIGDQEAQLNIRLDANALHQYGLTPAQVTGTIQASLLSSPAGSVDLDGRTEMVRVKGELNTIYNLDNMKLMTTTGNTLSLKQIAKVEAINEAKFIARLDENPAIGIHLYKTKDANAVEFGDAADQWISKWEKEYPNIKFHAVYNSATDIKHSINGMIREGGLGALLASLMILVFLRNFRMTLIVLVSIPLSLLITLMVMAPLGISLNIMTLGGMAIAVGRVVDDSIVVIENIYSQLQKAQERNESVIMLATKQVASAITSSTITTVGVFAPIAFVSGVVGEVFRPFAITLSVALLSSLLVALTVIPMLAKLLVMRSASIKTHDENHVGKMGQFYRKSLNWSLNNRIKTILLSGLLFILTIVLVVPNLTSSFMPESDGDKSMLLQIQLPRETSFESMDATMKQLESDLREQKDPEGKPKFTYIETLVGYNFSADRYSYQASIFSEFSKATEAKPALKELKESVKANLPKGSEVDGQLLSMDAGGGGVDFSYSLKGDDQLLLKEAALNIKEKMKEHDELYDIKDTLGESKMEIEVEVDQNKARLYGMTSAQTIEAVNGWIKETQLGDLKFDNVMYKTVLELDPQFKNSVSSIENIPIKTVTGTTIALKEIAKVREIDAPVTISREKQLEVVKVSAMIDSKDKGGVSQKVSAELDKLELPAGVSREVSGVSDDIANSFSEMFVAMIASVFIVYLIMVLAFGNAGAPFAILFSLPLAAIGGLLGLLVTRESVNVTSLIGFLMLIGIVVTNAIVLIDRVQQLRDQGESVRDALMDAGTTRLRPIIMTAGATIFALMPLALGMSEGTIISKGLAVVVIGGLTTSTLLTLVVVPIMYEMIHAFKGRMARLFKRKPKTPAQPTITVSE
ncbi:efflux RND transporter permease subunit [Gorillibacterium sp. sgz5001074]|uniref:efflux RND transporter permease subunit n=1 Tax=Gorillibacterium sp. sgz5001074 TaxID=3446695 RepID=UPI003F67C654